MEHATAPSAPTRQRRTRGHRPDTAELLRSWPSPVAGMVALLALVALAFDSGGYFPTSYLAVGIATFAVLGIVLAVRLPHFRPSTQSLVGLGALAALTAWTGISASWSLRPDAAIDLMQRDLVYVALFALGLFAAGSGRFAWPLVCGVLAVITVVVGAALLSRLAPDLVSDSGAGTPGYRLSWPFGYWNALGGMCAMGAVLALGVSSSPGVGVALRAATAGLAVICVTTMYLTLSRGSWMAALAGVVVLLLLGTKPGSLLVTGALVAGISALAIARLQTYHGLVDAPAAGAGQETEGHRFLFQLLALVLLTVAVQFVLAAGRANDALMTASGRVLRPVAIFLGVVVLMFAAGVYVARGDKVEGRSAGALGDVGDWVDRQWQDFLRPTTGLAQGTARLTTTKGTRSDLYRVAIDGFESDPVIGDGAGSFQARWMRTRSVDEQVRNAHSLELETLSELGLVGTLMLLALIGSLIAAALRARVRPGGLARPQAAAVGAACAVWLVHSFFDWDWQMPALTGTALILGASLYPYGRRRGRRRGRGPGARLPVIPSQTSEEIWLPNE